ncbi:MAG: mannose-1-phosphate guanylyltransferase [Oscillospiraceae bacterium]|nr:mannose-1-phosphate guanylyltransferase [Oscillospiraceae bacterium]MBR1458184.1 mannose-1-phosphate guanylyltransferase [Oscillospiraceae bacterium]MBR1899329.1 mannose-1-phosphate guanylyltransferase [Oscillospiraceae bacterium]
MKITAVIMAGGKGERFWPKSRTSCPKQFLSLTSDGETMIQKTVRRLTPMVAQEDVYIVTNAAYMGLIAEQLPDVPAENIIAEPAPRNTAPCIGLAAGIIRKKYGDAIMLVLPSDHLIHSVDMYLDTLRRAAIAAEDGTNLVTLGITPTYPETGYGYIKYVRGSSRSGVYDVERFVEKPDLNTAKDYLREGCYLWNSGMFIWKASSILKNIAELMPDLDAGLAPIADAYATPAFDSVLREQFPQLPAQSIDFGIMEHARNIRTIPGSFGWDDVGSWLALERINHTDDRGNYFDGDIVDVDTKSCTVVGSSKRTVAVLGLEDLVIVDTPDALLVCDKNSTQDIKKILAALREQKREELL